MISSVILSKSLSLCSNICKNFSLLTFWYFFKIIKYILYNCFLIIDLSFTTNWLFKKFSMWHNAYELLGGLKKRSIRHSALWRYSHILYIANLQQMSEAIFCLVWYTIWLSMRLGKADLSWDKDNLSWCSSLSLVIS